MLLPVIDFLNSYKASLESLNIRMSVLNKKVPKQSGLKSYTNGFTYLLSIQPLNILCSNGQYSQLKFLLDKQLRMRRYLYNLQSLLYPSVPPYLRLLFFFQDHLVAIKPGV